MSPSLPCPSRPLTPRTSTDREEPGGATDDKAMAAAFADNMIRYEVVKVYARN